jgi:hypothetical protein
LKKLKNNKNKIVTNLVDNSSISYLVQTHKTYHKLIEMYEPIIKKFIKNDSKIELLNEEEKSFLFQAIKDITNYITNGFLYLFNISKKPLDQREKVLLSIYSKIIYLKTSFKNYNLDNPNDYVSINLIIESLNEQIKDKIEFSIFCAIGLENYNKRSFLWDFEKQKKYNFIYFVKHRVAAIILELFLKSELESLTLTLNSKNNNFFMGKVLSESLIRDTQTPEQNLSILTGKDLLEKSGYKWVISEEYHQDIIDFLDGKISEKELMIPISKFRKILKLIYKGLKEKGIIEN